MYYRYTIASLSELLAVVRDNRRGFAHWAEHARSDRLRAILHDRAQKNARVAAELAELIRQLGGDPEMSRGTSGPARRGWVDFHPAVHANAQEALLEACERGEDRALEVYRNTLDEHLPELVRQVVLRQFEDMMSDRNEIRVLSTDARRTGIVAVSIGGNARQ